MLGFQLIAVFLGLMAAALATGMAWALRDLPLLARPIGDTEAPSLILEAANGEPLGRVGPLKSGDLSREDFSSLVVKAIISSEDQRFFMHLGIDPEGILRSLRRNLAAGAVVEGGSTITQQLVKMRLLRHSLSLTDKMREAFVAVWLEMQLTKEEILTRYLNSHRTSIPSSRQTGNSFHQDSGDLAYSPDGVCCVMGYPSLGKKSSRRPAISRPFFRLYGSAPPFGHRCP